MRLADILVRNLRNILPKVKDPRVTDYGKCVEIDAYVYSEEPDVGAGWERIVRYMKETGRPSAGLGVLLSWVGPYALVRMAVERLASDGRPAMSPRFKDEAMRKIEERCRLEVTKLGFELLRESDLNIPVDVDPVIMRSADGLLVPPPTVGKCLFYPWFVGFPNLYEG